MVKAAVAAQKTLFQPNIPPHTLLLVSNVLLLTLYEHNSATNIRYKLREQGEVSEASELRFLNLLLTSKLKKQSKSPTLWNYRRNLVKSVSHSLFKPSSLDTFPETFPDTFYLKKTNEKIGKEYFGFDGLHSMLIYEFTIVLKSAQVHKHNYYAWGYARWITNLVLDLPDTHDDSEQLKKLLSLTFAWISKHPSDTSGWSFFTYCALKLPKEHVVVLLETLQLLSDDYVGSEAYYVCFRTLLAAVSSETAKPFINWLERDPTTSSDLSPSEPSGEQVERSGTKPNTLESVTLALNQRDQKLRQKALFFCNLL